MLTFLSLFWLRVVQGSVEIGDFNEVKQQLEQKKAVMLIVGNMTTSSSSELEALQNTFYSDDLLSSYAVFFQGNCERLSEFCEQESVSHEGISAFFITKHHILSFDISNYIRSKKLPRSLSIAHLESEADFEDWKKNNETSALINWSYGQDIKQARILLIELFVEGISDIWRFAFFTNSSIFEGDKAQVIESNISLYSSAGNVSHYGNLDFDSMIAFLDTEGLEDVISFKMENHAKVFSSPTNYKLILLRQNDTNCLHLRSEINQLSQKNKIEEVITKRIVFVDAVKDITQERYPGYWLLLSDLFGDNADNNCQIFTLSLHNGEWLKFKWEKEQDSEDQLENFVEQLIENRLMVQYYKSEPIPKEQYIANTFVEKVVAQNFREKIIRDRKTSNFLLVCDKMDNDCKNLLGFWNQVALKRPEKLSFFFLESSKNDIPDIRVKNRPAFLFYPLGKKYKPEFFAKVFSYQNLLEWMNQQITIEGISAITLTNEEKKDFIKAIIEQNNPLNHEIDLEDLQSFLFEEE